MQNTQRPTPGNITDYGGQRSEPHRAGALAPLGTAIGKTRFLVLLAVLAVILVSLTLFVLGAWLAVVSVGHAWQNALQGRLSGTDLTVEFLEVVSVLLKAVVFYLIGVGLYSLFIEPLNVTVALGVETLNDLESKVISVVVVILAITFLEHFIRWDKPGETLQFAGSLALVVGALVFFQRYNHQAKEDQQSHHPDTQARAKRDMFEGEAEHHRIRADEVEGTADEKPPSRGSDAI